MAQTIRWTIESGKVASSKVNQLLPASVARIRGSLTCRDYLFIKYLLASKRSSAKTQAARAEGLKFTWKTHTAAILAISENQCLPDEANETFSLSRVCFETRYAKC